MNCGNVLYALFAKTAGRKRGKKRKVNHENKWQRQIFSNVLNSQPSLFCWIISGFLTFSLSLPFFVPSFISFMVGNCNFFSFRFFLKMYSLQMTLLSYKQRSFMARYRAGDSSVRRGNIRTQIPAWYKFLDISMAPFYLYTLFYRLRLRFMMYQVAHTRANRISTRNAKYHSPNHWRSLSRTVRIHQRPHRPDVRTHSRYTDTVPVHPYGVGNVGCSDGKEYSAHRARQYCATCFPTPPQINSRPYAEFPGYSSGYNGAWEAAQAHWDSGVQGDPP